MRRTIAFGVLSIIGVTASAQAPAEILALYSQQATQIDTRFTASVARGERLFRAVLPERGLKPTSCTTCHTNDPKAVGRTPVYKPILALAPTANADRLKDVSKVEKWLRRGCKDVLDRECTVQEKADVVQFLMSVK